MDSTFNIKLWKTSVYKGARKTTHTVRWELDGREWRQPFGTAALAESFRSQLVVAARRGEAFSTTTGRPLSQQSAANAVDWYGFAVQFADAQWARTSANNRKVVAKVLMASTVALLRAPVPSHIAMVDLRTALREFAFNMKRRDQAAPETIAILRWVERNTPSMAAWEDPAKVEAVLSALSAKLDGKPVALSSVKRTTRVLNVAMEYAVKQRILRENPLPKGRGTSPKTSSAVDKRSLVNPQQAALLLDAIRRRPRGGERLHALFATLYYLGLRPEEAVALAVSDARLPVEEDVDQWGELLIHTAQPEVGGNWTDSGEIHEERGLKGRAADDMRSVPCRPALTRILREHVEREGLKPGDLLFQGEKGDMLAGSVIRRAWRTAREKVLTPHEFESPLGRRVYDLRNTCLTNWLNGGIPPAQVADWAGNSVPVLLATYARCIDGQLADMKRRIEEGGDLPDVGA
ncbi:site-specific integrase [Streptomyces sp. NBC_01443]|uniref:tyrosine-type recombinase/integrase n=1 Tax=Streptomyces sp. NBC_01443 TaxID=2903868 RepID=UPI00224E0D1D|nr:site-specific integrase [Streptomyces sp. NBC_01443]MCX4629820.1 site-specific integrase [Streptomyces sp. NBC_01443]